MTTVKRNHGLEILYTESSDDFFFYKDVCCVADIVGNANVKASSSMNGGIVIFVSCEEAVNAVVSHGIVISNVMHIVELLDTPSLKLILSNVPSPFIGNERLIPFIEQHGKIISDICYLKASLKRKELQHVFPSEVRFLFSSLNLV